jgi:predicted aspartyl protease
LNLSTLENNAMFRFRSIAPWCGSLFVLSFILPAPLTAVNAAQQTLLQQVQQCIQQGGLPHMASASAPQAGSHDLAERCFFSVVMLKPDGSVWPNASDRLAALLRQTGVQMPFPKGQGQAKVSLQLQAGQALYRVPVTIKQQQFSFLLDTGASNTVIDSQTARRLSLEGKSTAANLLSYLAVGPQPSRQTPVIYSLPPISVGPCRVTKLVGIGLSTREPPFSSDGILGLDFLSQFDLVINPKTRSLSLLRPSSPVERGIPLKGKLGVMTLPSVYLNSKGPFTFLLDTGAAATALSAPLAQQLGLSLGQDSAVEVAGLGGQVSARWSRIKTLAFESHRVVNKQVLVTNSQVFQTLGVSGVIGQDILNQYSQRWRFGPPGPLGTPERGSLELTPVGGASAR